MFLFCSLNGTWALLFTVFITFTLPVCSHSTLIPFRFSHTRACSNMPCPLTWSRWKKNIVESRTFKITEMTLTSVFKMISFEPFVAGDWFVELIAYTIGWEAICLCSVELTVQEAVCCWRLLCGADCIHHHLRSCLLLLRRADRLRSCLSLGTAIALLFGKLLPSNIIRSVPWYRRHSSVIRRVLSLRWSVGEVKYIDV